VFKEELEGAQGHGAGGAGGVLLVAEVEEILTQFLFADLIGWFPIMGS